MFEEKENVKQVVVVKQKKSFISHVINSIFNVVFYGIVAIALAIVFLSTQSPDDAKSVMGLSMFYIETDSMHSIMPRGSVVVTYKSPAEDIVVGDNITFYSKINNSVEIVTHQVVEVIQDYEGQGLAFTTKGVNNTLEDEDKVIPANIIGTVKLAIPEIGIYFTYFRDNLIMSGVLIVLFVGLKQAISSYFREGSKEKQQIKEL